MKNSRRASAIFLSIIMLASAFSLSPVKVGAASPTGVYGGIAPSVMTSVIDDMEDTFEGEALGWSSNIGVCEQVSELNVAPYSPYEGGSSLRITAGAVSAGDKVKLSKSVEVISETSYYKSIAATFYIPIEAGSASVTMKLYGSRGTITDTKVIDAGKWQTVFFDTRELNEGKATKIEFTFEIDRDCELYILADSIGGCWSPYDMRSARYLTQGFEAEGCTVEYDRNVTVSLNGANQCIKTENVIETSFGDGIGLRVNMINHSSCRSLTLKYKTEGESEESGEITLDIPASDREVTLLYKIPEERIASLELCFNGLAIGDVEIISIGPSPCFETIPSIGSITECRIARDLKNVSVKGKVDILPTDGKAMLYVLMPNEDNSTIANLREPLAEARIKNGEFSFTVPLDRGYDGVFKKYVVAVNTESGLTVICEPSNVNNPELIATERTSLPESKKGIRPLPDNYVLYGIAQTAVDIDLSELMSSSGGTLSHTVGSTTRAFSKRYLEALDTLMEEYEREGIKVRLVFGYNAAVARDTNTLRAVSDLLVRRYGSADGRTDNLVGIVLGTAVNDAYNSCGLGDVTLSELAREYGNALRAVYNASVSVTSGFEVSIGLGGIWNGDLAVGAKGSFDARSTLEAIADYISASGDINWKLAYDITPERGEYAFKELSPERGVDAERITAANLETLTEFFSLPQFHFNGASRSILLLGNEERRASSENEEKLLTADYIYTFLRISDRAMRSISGYIPSHDADYGGALAYVGTDIFLSRSDFAAELIGRERFDSLCDVGALSDRSYLELEAGSTLPDGIKGESVIFNLKKKNMPIPSLNCVSAESGVSYGESSDWARILFGSADGEALRGFVLMTEYPIDLSAAPYVSFDVIVSSLPEGVDSVEIKVALYSKNNVAVANASIPVGVESKLVCDMSGFSHLSSCDRIGIYVTGENGEEIGEPMMLVSTVRAHSETLSGEKLDSAINVNAGEGDTVSVYTVINLAIVALVSVAILVLRIVIRSKRPTGSGDDE